MIIRVVSYIARPDEDVEGWAQGVASELRGMPGLRHLEFVRSQSNPSEYGAVMYFKTMEDIDNYKTSEFYQKFVQELRETWLDESKPSTEQIFEVLDI